MSNHVPERSCVICRKRAAQPELIKFVKTSSGVKIVRGEKLCGRGAYLCKNPDCIKKAKKSKILNKVFKCNVEDSVYEELENELF